MKILKILTCTLFFVACIYANENASQWRGENRSGHFTNETGLMKQWPEDGPKKILEVSGLGDGWSSPTVTRDQIFVTGKFDTLDYLTAISTDGKIQWKKNIGRAWFQSFSETRITPVVQGNKVYTHSGDGEVSCFDTKSGNRRWYVNVDSLAKSRRDRWGVSETPLIYKDLIVTTPAGDSSSLVALNKRTGEIVWQTPPVMGNRSYLSAILYKYKEIEQIISMTSDNLFAVNPENGEIIWTFDYARLCQETEDLEWWGGIPTNCPIYINDKIFFSHGYNYPAVMFKMASDGKSIMPKWVSRILDSHHHGVVEYNGYIYGTNWLDNRKGDWACLNWDTGEVGYEFNWFGKGVIVEADELFYIMDENKGNIGLLNPNPEKFDLISSFQFEGGKGKYWCHPTIFNKKLYIRHGEILQVFHIAQ